MATGYKSIFQGVPLGEVNLEDLLWFSDSKGTGDLSIEKCLKSKTKCRNSHWNDTYVKDIY